VPGAAPKPGAKDENRRTDRDLPAIPGGREAPPPQAGGEFEWDLPSVGQSPAPAKPAPFDLPDLPGFDLPAARGTAEPKPSARRAGFQDLPSLTAELPLVQGHLPSSVAGLPERSAGLPERSAGLPERAAGLPERSAGLPERAAGLPERAAGLPVARAAGAGLGFGEIDLDGLGEGPRHAAFGEIDLPPMAPSLPPRGNVSESPPFGSPQFDDSLEADPFGEAPLAPPSGGASGFAERPPNVARRSEPAIVRATGGGVGYGEVNLEGGPSGDDVPIEGEVPIRSRAARGEEEMEFGALPQERRPVAATPSLPSRGAPSLPLGETKRSGRKWRVLGVVFVLALAGGALSLLPAFGPFGAHWISDRLNADQHRRLLTESEKAAREKLGRDTRSDATSAFKTLESASATAKRFAPLSAEVAFVGYLGELRFGGHPQIAARSQVIVGQLAEAEGVEVELARAAALSVDGPEARAKQVITALARRFSRDVDAQVLLAEYELKRGEPSAMLSAWQNVGKLEQTARSAFGLARAKLAAGDEAGAQTEARTAIERNPKHVGARILVARVLGRTRATETEGVKLLESLIQEPGLASSNETVEAQTLLGEIHLARARVSKADAAFSAALKLSPQAGGALAGLGEALFRGSRYSEALARFDAALQADPNSVTAKLGAAKSKLSLERLEEALASLAALSKAEPKDARVALWYGRALEVQGERERAQAVYRAGIKAAGASPDVVDLYIALALHENQNGRPDAAQKTLAAARAALPESSALYRANAEVAMSQGRESEAVRALKRAIEIDPEDLAASFKLGIALRKTRAYTEATTFFDRLAAADPEYPGLALERGLLFEDTGRTEEALKSYESALAKAPGDVDLMLRVGCGKVAAGRSGEASELLRKVLSSRPNSAETNHCLGRALLIENHLPDARRLLDRAIEIDPNRAEYHLYSGWAANEAGDIGKADRELAEALKLDKGLADAYWQRGVLRAKKGAVRDAVQDLMRALELNPGRVDAHASLADAYYDLGREREALSEWEKAIAGQPDNAVWRFRYGKLLVVNHMNDAGAEQLKRAIEAGEKLETKPRWLWEAHHFMARALGTSPAAAEHWEAFLRLGPRDSPYRKEAKLTLQKLGRPWNGD
jgi:tetratricopeptide (TPR) repeat protein